MAVLENKHYYKIEPEKCFIQTGEVFVYVKVYESEADRLREKGIALNVQRFNENCDAYLGGLADDDKQYSAVESAVYSINRYIFDNGGVPNIAESALNVLKANGFVESWIEHPIKRLTTVCLNCGAYHGEELTVAYYYQKLKNRMSDYKDV